MPHPEPSWRRYLRFWRTNVAADVDDEIAFHLDERTDDLVARGVAPDAARAQALAEFGDVAAVRARLRAIGARRERRRGWAERWDAVRQDAAYAARSVARAPGLAATVVVTLALGLGANGAVFALVDRLFFRPPPAVADPARVRRLYVTQRQPSGEAFTRAPVSYPEFLDLAAAAAPSAQLAAYRTDDRRLGREGGAGGGGAETVSVVYAGGGYFALLGVRPALGRFFSAEEERIDVAAPVVVLSDDLWRRRFGGDSAVIGRTLDLGRERLTVIGVAPPQFAGVDVGAADLWIPLGAMPGPHYGAQAWYQSRMFYGFLVLARLAPGPARGDAAVRQLEARATTALRRGDAATNARIAATSVVSTGPVLAARGPEAAQEGREAAIAVRLAGVALAVLLIACANVANLLLARGVRRRREIAVRLALGVGRRRLGAMLATEGVLLALLGGAASLVAAAWGGAALRAWLLPDVLRWDGPALDGRVAVFVAACATLTGVLAGLAPALRASGPDLTTALKAGAREGTFRRSRLRTALVVVQAALSVVLLAGAGLFVRSLENVRALDVGYDAERLVVASVAFDDGIGDLAAHARAADLAAGLDAVAARLAGAPGVGRVALATMAPMRGFSFLDVHLPGRDSLPPSPSGPPAFTGVSPDYFAAAGLRVLRGRSFTAGDRAGAPRVLVVNATMAHTLWRGADPIGQCVRFGARTAPCYAVVGVVEDARRSAIVEAPAMMYYAPLAQPPAPGFAAGALVIRATTPERTPAVAALSRAALAERFPGAEPRARSLADVLAPELRPWRLGATLFSLLGGLALLVAAVGVYSTVAYGLGQRRHEFAVRAALGARAASLLRLGLADGVRAAGAGVVVGVGMTLAAGRLVASLLYGLSPRDPGVLATVAATLLAAALLASLAPAWRATRVDPADALRDE